MHKLKKLFRNTFIAFALFFAVVALPVEAAIQQPAVHEAIAAETAEPGNETAAAPAEEADILGTLGIDLKLFIGQLINFAIILLVLWKWVFTPVAKKLTERTEKIEKAMLDADQSTKDRAEFEKWKAEQIVNARHEASAIIAQSQNEAGKAKEKALKETKEEQERMLEQAKKQILEEKDKALKSAKGELADMVTMATEKILRQKLDGKKDEGLIKDLLKDI